MFPFRAQAILKCGHKFVVRPPTDAGFIIRRNVGGIKSAEGGFKRTPTSHWLALFGCVACDAAAGIGQIFTVTGISRVNRCAKYESAQIKQQVVMPISTERYSHDQLSCSSRNLSWQVLHEVPTALKAFPIAARSPDSAALASSAVESAASCAYF